MSIAWPMPLFSSFATFHSPKHAAFRCSNARMQLQVSHSSKDMDIPKFVEAVVEVPQGSFIKRHPDGAVDFVAPFPCPFNYGSVPSITAADGDPLDAVILDKYLPYQSTGVWKVNGIVKFVDAGAIDNKLICTPCVTEHLDSGRSNSMLKSANHDSYPEKRSSSGLIRGLTLLEVLTLNLFFSTYAIFKVGLNMARGKSGRTAFDGIELFT